MDLLDSFWGIVLPAIFSAYPVFIMFQFFVSIPEEVLDAARIDGANEWQLFVRIGVPLGKTGIISSMMLSVLECWNMIEQPMVFLDTKSRWPVALYVPQITENGIGVSFAVSILVLILPFLVFLAGRHGRRAERHQPDDPGRRRLRHHRYVGRWKINAGTLHQYAGAPGRGKCHRQRQADAGPARRRSARGPA